MLTDWKEQHLFTLSSWKEKWKSHLSPSPAALVSPTEQMGTDTSPLKVLSALLGGDVYTGQAAGIQPGPPPGLASGTFCRGRSGISESGYEFWFLLHHSIARYLDQLP